MKNKPKVIGFEGMHRSGKGTQIKLSKEYLENEGYTTIIRRGEGTRRGLGQEEYDPLSSWWKENYNYLFRTPNSPQETIEIANTIYQRIVRENNYDLIQQSKHAKSAILLDRSFISRFFMMKQCYPDISLESALLVYHPKNHTLLKPVIPDLTFILRVDKDELIRRCIINEEDTRKSEFRRQNIIKKYELFEGICESLSNETQYPLRVIDGNKSIDEVQKEIQSSLLSLI